MLLTLRSHERARSRTTANGAASGTLDCHAGVDASGHALDVLVPLVLLLAQNVGKLVASHMQVIVLKLPDAGLRQSGGKCVNESITTVFTIEFLMIL